jgi:hypothetical protein
MILQLFVLFLILSIILIALGLRFTEHTELVLIGFVFLFTCGGVVLSNNVEVHSLTNSTVSYIYTNSSSLALNSTNTQSLDIYSSESIDSGMSHTFGLYIMIAAGFGFIFVLFNLKRNGGFSK